MSRINQARILAIDPTARGFAYVVLEGSERLIDWGVSHVSLHSKRQAIERLDGLLLQYAPDLLVTENWRSRRGAKIARGRGFLRLISTHSERDALPLRTIRRSEVQFVFRTSGKSKHAIAEALARFFPELEDRLPRKRKPWMSEDERMNIFDALSFAVTVFRSPEALSEIS